MTNMFLTSTQPKVLNTKNIVKAYLHFRSLGAPYQPLRKCLLVALMGFSGENNCLQMNAQLLIHCEGTQLVFVSGDGESIIEVSFVQGEPSYRVLLPQFSRRVKRLPCGLLALSVENLKMIRDEIVSWREVTKGLKKNLESGLDHFAKEPVCIQENSRMVIQKDGRKLELLSGDGKNFIHFYQYPENECQYDIQVASFWDRIKRNVFRCLARLYQ